ncbi:hypothetical protein ACHAPO_001274 [Fusarium lateritium]
MFRLFDLPDELLNEIVLFVSDDGSDKTSLKSLTLTNKRLQSFSSPLLMSHWHNYCGPYNYRGDHEFGLLALHLLRNPQHRSQLRSLKFQNYWTGRYLHNVCEVFSRDQFITEEMTAEMADEAERTVPDLADFSEGWIDRVDEGMVDAVLALVLAWANRLTEVSLDFRGRYESVDKAVICRSLSRLPLLRTVEIDMGYFLPIPENVESFAPDIFVSMMPKSLTKLVITWKDRDDTPILGTDIPVIGYDENRTCSLITEAIGMLLQEAGPGYKFSKLRCIDALDIKWEPDSLENAVELGNSRGVRVIEPISMIRSIL